MIASVALMVQLRPAQKPPQLFKSNTNLQRLLDLAANFSHSDIHCDDCSGFYKVIHNHERVQINQKYLDFTGVFTRNVKVIQMAIMCRKV